MTADRPRTDVDTVRWYLDKRDDRAGWEALDRIEAQVETLQVRVGAAQVVAEQAIARQQTAESNIAWLLGRWYPDVREVPLFLLQYLPPSLRDALAAEPREDR